VSLSEYPAIRYAGELPRTADLVVVGGGIVGAATAFFAARAGLRCVVLEKRARLCSLTTPASTGAFRAQFDNPEEMRLVQESIALFESFGERVGLSGPGADIGLVHGGYLWLTTTPEGAARQGEIVRRQREWGLRDVELLSGDEARRRFPYLAPEVVSARFRAGDGWLDPRRVTNGLAAGSGATFCLETAATGFELAGGRLRGVRTTRGTVSCDAAVIACGPFSGAVAALAGLRLPVTLRVRQKLLLPEVPEVPLGAPMTIDEDTGAHWRPALSGGAYLLYTNHQTPTSPPLEDVPTSVDFAFDLLDPRRPHGVARIAPFWRTVWERNADPWLLMGGQYTYTPDHRPLLGPTEVTGLAVNTGYSGHGIMGGPGGSRLTVDALLGRLPAPENPFRPDRPMLPRELDIL
jgi:sarcosine oxidase, subunit beta